MSIEEEAEDIAERADLWHRIREDMIARGWKPGAKEDWQKQLNIWIVMERMKETGIIPHDRDELPE